MLKLKAIINQLTEEDYSALENQLNQSKAFNFLSLFRGYREDTLSDEEIIDLLNSNINSFHTLKSRLYDKIQLHLIENPSGYKSDILSQLANIPKFCYEMPREIAQAILHKLEKDLKDHDMSGDLISVYSALKKIHLHTPKYYEYSQLYNKHLAYTMSLEKAEELLGSFNRTLSQYYMSKSPALLEMLLIFKRETKNIYLLNKSPHIEVIRNTIIIHLQLFTTLPLESEESIDDLLESTEKIIQKFPNNSQYNIYGLILSFLRYEYYIKIGQYKKAQGYFDEVNNAIKNWLLLDNLCLAYHFLYSKLNNYCRRNLEEQLSIEADNLPLVFDTKNTHTLINIRFYNALSKFYAGKYRESTSLLNDLLNNTSYKDMLHSEIEVKLTLSYIYVKLEEYDLAGGLLRSIYRKIKSQEQDNYENAIVFSRMLGLMMDFAGSDNMKAKILKYLRLYEFENSGERKILIFMECEFEKLKLQLK